MTVRTLPRALPRLLVWIPGLLALILTGCYTVNNHYYGTPTPSSGAMAGAAGNTGDCPCHQDYGTADQPRAYYPSGTPCPDRRASNPYYGGYYAGYPYYHPWYYHGPRYSGGQASRGSGTSDVDDHPAYVGGVPATDRRPRGSGGGDTPRSHDNDVHSPADNPVHAGGKETGRHPGENDAHAPADGGVVSGGFDRPRSNDNDTQAPATGPAQAGGIGADPRRDGNDVHAPTGGDPQEGEVERPRRAERDVHAPTTVAGRPTAAAPVSIPEAGASTSVPATTEPRRNEAPRSVPVTTRTTSERATRAPAATEPRRSEHAEDAEASREHENSSSSETAAPATAPPQPATAAPATAAPATAAPATSRRGNN